MGRLKREVPTGKMRLKYPKTGYDPSKEYTLYYEYNWNREIIRRDSGFRVKVSDWNQCAANGRGEFRASYGDESKRCNKLIANVLQQTDASLKEYSIKHPGIMTAEIVRSILFNKPLTRDDEGQDFIEYVISNLKARLNANKIGISRYENGVSGMKIFREFLEIKNRGTYKPDSIYLGEISGKLIDEYIDFRRNIKKNEATTINHSLTPIILACENAKMRGYIKESVYAEIKDKRLVEPATPSTEDGFDGKYLRPEEIQKLINFYNHDTEPRRKEYIEMFLFAFHAGGLRLVDVMTLQWKHINFETKEMKKILIKTSKTQKQRHTVPLTPSAIAILEKWKGMGRRAKFVFDLLPSDDIDVTVESEIYGRRNSVDKKINQALKVVATKIGVDKLTFHMARHSFAVNALNDPDHPLDMYQVSRLLGHASTESTERVYAEYVSESLSDKINKLNFAKYLPNLDNTPMITEP